MNLFTQKRNLALSALCLFALLWPNACAQPSSAPPTDTAAAFAPAFNRSVEPVRSETVNRLFTRSCSTCHGPDGHGLTAIAPDLRRVKTRTLNQWQQYLISTHPGAQMPPPTWLNVDEIAVIANYLVSLSPPPAAQP